MAVPHRIVILGAGFGGLTIAHRLDEFLNANPTHAESVSVTVVDKSNTFTVGAAHQYVISGVIKPEEMPWPYTEVSLKHVVLRHSTEILKIDVASRSIVVATKGNPDETLEYDELVVALGIHLDTAQVEGIPTPGSDPSVFDLCTSSDAARFRDTLASFNGGNIVIAVPQLPYKCPPVPGEFGCIIDTLLQKRDPDVRSKTNIILTNPMQGPPPADPKVSKKMLQIYKSRGLDFRGLHQVVKVSTAEKKVYYASREIPDPFIKPSNKRPIAAIPYDLLLLMGPLRPPHVLKTSGLDLNPMGFVIAEVTTLRTPTPGVYCCGDAAALSGPPAPKAGMFAAAQGDLVATNLIACIENPSLRGDWTKAPFSNWNKGSCHSETGHGEGVILTVDWLHAGGPVYEVTESASEHYDGKIAWLQGIRKTWFGK
eukprot:Opistho-2@53879